MIEEPLDIIQCRDYLYSRINSEDTYRIASFFGVKIGYESGAEKYDAVYIAADESKLLPLLASLLKHYKRADK